MNQLVSGTNTVRVFEKAKLINGEKVDAVEILEGKKKIADELLFRSKTKDSIFWRINCVIKTSIIFSHKKSQQIPKIQRVCMQVNIKITKIPFSDESSLCINVYVLYNLHIYNEYSLPV